ncbi:hypothetical protein DIPPA_11560 [Diplonema papillatum]|nr:hypothetical protein DIPPA_11560 [Diplonema papillatum]
MSDAAQVKELRAEIEKLRHQLAAETRLRVFADAALAQRLARVEKVVGLAAPGSEEADESDARPSAAAKPPPHAHTGSGCCAGAGPSSVAPQQQAQRVLQQRSPVTVPAVRPLASALKPSLSTAVAQQPGRPLKPGVKVKFMGSDVEENAGDPFEEEPSPVVTHAAPAPLPAGAAKSADALNASTSSATSTSSASSASPAEVAAAVSRATGKPIKHGTKSNGEATRPAKVFQVGSKVQVQCSNEDGSPRWDVALVLESAKGLYRVKFPDGEVFSDVLPSYLRDAVVTARDWAHVMSEECIFSGFVWLYEFGWIQNSMTKHWMLLVEDSLHFATDPSEHLYSKELSLKGLSLVMGPLSGATTDAAKTFSLTAADNTVKLSIAAESAYEYKMWVLMLTVALVRVNKTEPSDDEKLSCLEFSQLPRRYTVPTMEDDTKPEEKNTYLAKGYIISKKSNSWISRGDWGRRWVTLHEGWMTLRANKQTLTDLQVIPLRDTALAEKQDDVENPYAIELSGSSLKPPLVLCYDSSEVYMKWCLLLHRSWLMANPEQTHSGLPATELAADKPPGHL